MTASDEIEQRTILLARTSGGWFDNGSTVWFHRQPDGPDDDYPEVVALCIDLAQWSEFGEPSEVTLTIKPGDALNGAEVSGRSEREGEPCPRCGHRLSAYDWCPSCLAHVSGRQEGSDV